MSKRSGGHAIKEHCETLEPRRLLSLGVLESSSAGGEFSGETTTDVAVAPGGQYIVASSFRVYSDLDIEATRYAADGSSIGPAIALFHADRADHYTFHRISAATDADGDSVVAYTVKEWTGSKDQDTFTSALYVNRISRTGATGTPIVVQKYDSPYHGAEITDVSVSMSDDGGFFVGWVTTVGEERSRATVRAFGASGRPRAAAFDVVRSDAGRAAFDRFDVAAKADGSGAVYAVDETSRAGTNRVVRYGFTTASREVGTAGTIATKHGTSEPSVSTFADGSFVLSFTDGKYDYDHIEKLSAYAQRYDAAGRARGKAVQLGMRVPGEGAGVYDTSVAAIRDGSNGFVAAYVRSIYNQDDYGDWAYVEHYNGSASSDSGPVLVDSETGLNDYFGTDRRIELSADASGHLAAAFISGLLDEGTYDEWAVATRLTTAPAALVGSELRVFGGVDDDTLTVEQNGRNVIASVNDDALSFDVSRVQSLTIDGSVGDDRIVNDTALPSTIHGGAGDDRIDGGAGADKIHGDDGADDLSGNDGNDNLRGDAGNDIVVGNNGNDTLDGGTGRDRLYGYTGDDWLYSKDGEVDQLFGNAGRNRFDRDGDDVVK